MVIQALPFGLLVLPGSFLGSLWGPRIGQQQARSRENTSGDRAGTICLRNVRELEHELFKYALHCRLSLVCSGGRVLLRRVYLRYLSLVRTYAHFLARNFFKSEFEFGERTRTNDGSNVRSLNVHERSRTRAFVSNTIFSHFSDELI